MGLFIRGPARRYKANPCSTTAIQTGITVSRVTPGCASYEAGLEAGDILVAVNGEDVSNASHEEAVATFCKAQEPIIIEVLRRASAAAPQPDDNTAPASSVRIASASIATQTDGYTVTRKGNEGAGSQSCPFFTPPPPPEEPSLPCAQQRNWNHSCSRRALALSAASELCLTDIERTYEDSADEICQDALMLNDKEIGNVSGSCLLDRSPIQEFLYEEVVLCRQAACERVGLTLCYAPGDDGTTCVFVGEVEPGGAAALDGRICEGDRIVEINGEEVHSREAVIRLFSVNQTEIRLLICRSSPLQWEDDGFVEEHSNSSAFVNVETSQAARYGSGAQVACTDESAPLLENNQSWEATPIACYSKSTTVHHSHNERSDKLSNEPGGEQCLRLLQALKLQSDEMHASCTPDEAVNPAVPNVADPFVCSRGSMPRMGTRLKPPVNRSDAPASPQSDSTSCSDHGLGRDPSPEEHPIDEQQQDSSGHDTAYNTAESCRSATCTAEGSRNINYTSERCHSASLCLKQPSDSSLLLFRGGSMLSLTSSAQPEEAGGTREDRRVDKKSRDNARRSCSSNSSSSSKKSSQRRGGEPMPCEDTACEIMYTNKENLASTIALQQRLLEQRLIPFATVTEAEHASATCNEVCPIGSATTAEWVLKRRPDGSRYVVRRTVATATGSAGGSSSSRSRLLEERQRRLERERASFTTDDDDAASELKVGRYWSRADRRRHVANAREGRRRKDQRLQGGRMNTGNEDLRGVCEEEEDINAEASSKTNVAVNIVTLSQQKQSRQWRQRDMDFVTVQELLVRGGRAPALLTVTTV